MNTQLHSQMLLQVRDDSFGGGNSLRRLFTAHRIACEEDKKEIAVLLIDALELDLSSIGGDRKDRRKKTDSIEAAFDIHEKTYGAHGPGDVE